ncbi:MAG: hypothetical protein DBY08_00900 [Clostridiales bacterium]|nr:MerR family transcriptional regulator [Bacillota bacterium]PWL94981.1 MAG: hypothetical protein DBY08_00900 [Clostridiales bacterium]
MSKILNISNEMIRYYEKCGVIEPNRNNNNKYREYTMRDIFALTECLYYKSWGIKLSDIKDSIYTCDNNALDNMCLYKKELSKKIDYLQLKCKRIDEIIQYQKTFRINEGNYWIKMIPSKKVFAFAAGTQEQFANEELFIDNEFGSKGFFNDDLIFFDIEIKLDNSIVKWNYTIESKYFESLEAFKALPAFEQREHLCLCTVLKVKSFMDIGTELLNPILDYAKEKKYSVTGPVNTVLIGRSYEKNEFFRYIEIQVPVEIDK